MSTRLAAALSIGLICLSAPVAAKTAKPRVGMSQARAKALAQVPGGRVVSADLEHEKGLHVYSFDIRRPGRSGIDEVQIDADTGRLVSRVHETPADERAEKKADARRR